jgi:hypothetical protein
MGSKPVQALVLGSEGSMASALDSTPQQFMMKFMPLKPVE